MALPTLDMALEILNTDTASDDKLSILYRGREGSGKTHNLTTFPEPYFLFTDKNLATLKKFKDLHYTHVKDWKHFTSILQGIQNDELPGTFKTITLDTASSLFTMCYSHYESQGYAGFDLWRMLLGNFVGRMSDVIDLSKAHKGTNKGVTYHVAISCHEKDIYKGTDGVLQRIGLKIQGQSADEVGPLFDSVFCCDSETKSALGKPGEAPSKVTSHFIYTTNPDAYRHCKDGVGGDGTRYSKLPHRMPGGYSDLLKAWGMEDA